MLPLASKEKIKFIKSLQLRKNRQKDQSFLVEGSKSVIELLRSDFLVTYLLVSKLFYQTHFTLLEPYLSRIYMVKSDTLDKIGSFKTNNAAIAVAKITPNLPLKINKNEFSLALDGIKDPGNLGSMIRIADWYGISKVIVSKSTADIYNPKVIAATMGSFTRVKVFYTDLSAFIREVNVEVFGAFLEGTNLHEVKFGNEGLIVIGNESTGISSEIEQHIQNKITVPGFGGAESLNAAMSTAVICDNLRRCQGSDFPSIARK